MSGSTFTSAHAALHRLLARRLHSQLRAIPGRGRDQMHSLPSASSRKTPRRNSISAPHSRARSLRSLNAASTRNVVLAVTTKLPSAQPQLPQFPPTPPLPSPPPHPTHNNTHRFSKYGTCQGCSALSITGSLVGGSIRMWVSHDAHSRGTWDALKSHCPYETQRWRPGISSCAL